MSTPEIKSEAKAPEAKAPEVAQKGQAQMGSWSGRDRVPSDWSIVPAEGEDMIEASNSSTGRVFTGTVAEFNQKLRG